MRSLSPGFLLLFFFAAPVWAVDPQNRISQYAHTAWRVRDGVFSGSPNTITQTTDGYLWIGTQVGLVRFDGVRFTPWTPPNGKRLPSSQIAALLGASDGSLWIGTGSGLAQWKNGDLINFPETGGRINSIFEDREGTIWAARSRNPAGGLCRVSGGKVRCYTPQDGIPAFAVSVIGDGAGNLWIGYSMMLMRWNPESHTVYNLPRLKSPERLKGVGALAPTPDGAIWVGMPLPGRELGLQQLAQGAWKAFVTPTFDSSSLQVTSLWLDRRNSLWIGTEGAGVYRIYDGKVDRFHSTDGLSSDSVENFFEDREGNQWIVTSEGIDRFRDNRVINFSIHEGLSGNKAASVLASRDGAVRIGNSTGLDFVRGGLVSTIGPKNGLPGGRVTALLEDHAGRFWIGVENGLFVCEGSRFTPIKRRNGSPTGPIIAMTEDVDGNIWAEVVSPPTRLLRIQDQEIREEVLESQMPFAYALAADPRGGIWLGFMNGGLARYRKGQLETFPLKQWPSGRVFDLIVNSDGSVLGATSEGLVEYRNGNLRALTVQNGLPCNRIITIIFDRQSDLWLYAECGLIEIARDQLQKWREQPDVKIKVSIFDVFDGAQPMLPSFRPAATRSNDGRLWFATEKLVQVIDPEHLAGNSIPPPVLIEDVIADRKRYSPGGDLSLPPLTRDIEIDYTALSFVVSQKVRFRYKLEGYDADWQDPGTRRQAFYNDLRPGKYTFHVIACNNDGVWNETGATLAFRVAPAWYQTNWFLILCAGASLFLVWSVYSLRVRRISRAISVRFDERLAERTRIARELHDTLLQTVQGSKLVADNALEKSDDSAQMRRALEKLSKWLGQATQEGRAALNSLRTSTIETNDLAAGLRRATEGRMLNSSMAVKFSVAGSARDMHPIVRDEIYRIGYEAIRNACEHSSARQLEVTLNYAQDLTLRVKDNGIGMEPAVLAYGKAGHFGLLGMRERAGRIASKFTLVSSPNSGTEIMLVVPGGIIFRKTSASRFERIKAVFRRIGRTSSHD
jgi:signal transduction histidine kinase/ligand-binding sensor domain-containing protein